MTAPMTVADYQTLVPTSPTADVRNTDTDFVPLFVGPVGTTDAEIIAVDTLGRWQYIRVGTDVHRRDQWTYTAGRWEMPLHMWDANKDRYLS